MVTTRKTTKKNSNQVYNHPVYKDGYYEIITDVPTQVFLPVICEDGIVSLITYKGKVINVAGRTSERKTPWVADLEYVQYSPKYSVYYEPATGRFSPKTVIKLLNTPRNQYPHLKLISSHYDALPASVMMRLGFRRIMWSRKR